MTTTDAPKSGSDIFWSDLTKGAAAIDDFLKTVTENVKLKEQVEALQKQYESVLSSVDDLVEKSGVGKYARPYPPAQVVDEVARTTELQAAVVAAARLVAVSPHNMWNQIQLKSALASLDAHLAKIRVGKSG